MDNNYTEIEYWFELAAYDMDTAKAMLKTKRYLYVGFMCHQVMEKVLKGIFVSRNKRIPPYTHNLAYLAEESGIYKNISEKQKDILDKLEPLNIEARYPLYKDKVFKELNQEKCEKIVNETEDIYSWIKKRL